ncbi:MAG: hypothetical protein KKD31_14615 [Bacteroidetes bacterium]|nr:hypothetical protein [Bacteroidota bacterium]
MDAEMLMGLDVIDGSIISDQDLEGLGLLFRPMIQQNPAANSKIVTPATRQKILPALNRFIAPAVKQAATKAIESPGQSFLISQADKYDDQVKKDIRGGRMRFMEADFYGRVTLAGSPNAIQELVNASEDIECGTKNFDKDVLSEKSIIAITAMKLSYGYHASVTEPQNIAYTNALNSGTGIAAKDDGTVEYERDSLVVPNLLLNGEVEILVDGVPVMTKFPIKKFFREALSVNAGTEGMTDVVKFRKPILIQPRQDVQIRIRFANITSGTLGSNNHFMEYRLMGDQIAPRG